MKRILTTAFIGLMLLTLVPGLGSSGQASEVIVPLPGPILLPAPGRGGSGPPLLRLLPGDVDPLQLEDPAPTSDQPRLYVVQFKDLITTSSHAVLKYAGVEAGPYIPDFAFAVRMTPQQARQVQGSSLVRAVALYRPEWKLPPDLGYPGEQVDVQVTAFPGDGLNADLPRFQSLTGAMRVTPSEGGFRLLGMPLQSLSTLAADDEILFIDLVRPVELYNDIARWSMQVEGSPASPWMKGLKGANQVVGLADTGLDTGSLNTLHPDFAGRVLRAFAVNDRGQWSDPDGHGTHVAGSVVGNGASSGGQFAGVAPESRLVLQSIVNADGGLSIPSQLSELFEQARLAGAQIHTNSWGFNARGLYTSEAAAVDSYMWGHKAFSILFAAGNAGPRFSSIKSPGTAKNAITVGASENVRLDLARIRASDSNNVALFSSRGLISYKRVKPDVVAPGSAVLSTRSALAPPNTFWGVYENPRYTYMGGTSTATALTAGAAALVRQGLQQKGFTNPSAALIKATLINGAQEMGMGWMSPDYGWGRVDLVQSLNPGAGRANSYRDVTAGLATRGTHTYSYAMKSGQILKFTLVWTDYPGNPAAAVQLVNDLDLVVTGPDGTQYLGNCFTDDRSTAAPGCATFDGTNNVENVYIAAPVDGTYTVRVQGYNVPRGPQPYALVVSGLQRDTGLPTVRITSPTAGSVVKGMARITATAADNVGVSRVEFYNGTTLLDSVESPGEDGTYSTTLDTSLLLNSSRQTLTAKAYDYNQNAGTASLWVVVDNQGPSISLTAPASGARVRGTVSVSASVTDDRSVARVEFSVDDLVRYTDTASPYTWAWHTTSIPDGTHMVRATVYDRAGNMASRQVEVTVDNSLPPPSFTPAAGSWVPAGQIPLTVTAPEPNDFARVEFFAGTTRIGTGSDGQNGWTATWDTTAVKTGTYALKAVAVDQAGISRTFTNSVTVDSVSPGLAISSPLPNAKLTGTVTIRGTATDNMRVGWVKIYLDDELQATLTPPVSGLSIPWQWTWVTSGDGPRLLRAVVADAAGNRTEQSFTVYLDHTDPVVAITSPVEGSFSGDPVTVAATDNTGIARVDFYLNGVKAASDSSAPYTWAWNPRSLLPGSTHTLTARAYDLVGRVTTSAPVTVTADSAAPRTLFIAVGERIGSRPVRGSIPVTAMLSEDEAVTQVQFYIDEALVQTVTAAPFTFTWETAGVTDGSHKVTAVASYPAGTSQSAYAMVTVDNTAPTYTLSGLTDGQQIRENVTVSLSARDNVQLNRALVFLDDDPNPLRSSSLSTALYSTSFGIPGATLSDGPHTLRIHLIDSAENVREGTEAFQVDSSSPTVSLTSPADGTRISPGTIMLEASTSAGDHIARVDFYAGTVKIGSDTDGANGWSAAWTVTASTPSGDYLLKAIAHDPAGNTASASRIVSIDNTAPAVTVTSPAANLTLKGTEVALSARATDAKGLQRFEVLVDGQVVDSVTPEGPPADYTYSGVWNTAAASPGGHTVTFRATDIYGNVASRAVTVKVDNAGPAITITSPTADGYVRASHLVTATLTDTGTGIKKVEVLVNGTAMKSIIPSAPMTNYDLRWTWSTTGLESGKAHQLMIRATDTAGNISTGTVSVLVETAGPDVTLQSPAAGLVRGRVGVDITATDNSGVQRAELFVGATLLAALNGSGSATESFHYEWDSTARVNGIYPFKAVVYDLAGNSTAKSISVTVDNIAPSLRIDAPENNALVTGTLAVSAVTSDYYGVERVEFYLDDVLQATDTASAYAWTWNTTTSSNGSHTITVKSYDRAGNVRSASVVVTVENPAH